MLGWRSPQMRAFREEVRAFCDANLPDDLRRRVLANQHLDKQDYLRWQKILHGKGWIAGHWPKIHGGQDWSPLRRYIFEEETAKAGAPWLVPFGVAYIGPVLIKFGSAAQQRAYLPSILTSDIWWAQGYSEPTAGSDLAGLRTRAERRGDRYILNGHKIWTTMAQWADMMFCLARTQTEGRPQDAISFLLVDMHAKGVTVRPIVTLEQCHHVNEVFLEDVEVPVENLVGTEGKGWSCAKFLLANERMLAAEVGKTKRLLRRLRAVASSTKDDGRPLDAEPTFARKLARAEVDLRALEAVCLVQLDQVEAGAMPGVEASILKIRGSEVLQIVTQLMIETLQRVGLPYQVEALDPSWNGVEIGGQGSAGMVREYLLDRAATIYGGSNEIQRNIIAKAALGL